MRRTDQRTEPELGTCYRDAGRAVAFQPKDEGQILVHGTVFSPVENQRIDHAWVLLPKGLTIEDDTGDSECLTEDAVLDFTMPFKYRLLPKRVYDLMGQVTEDVRYTQAETRERMLTSTHWGPWHLGGPDEAEGRRCR